jgi:hypothetical protein
LLASVETAVEAVKSPDRILFPIGKVWFFFYKKKVERANLDSYTPFVLHVDVAPKIILIVAADFELLNVAEALELT